MSQQSYKKDPEKARQHRFIITGLHEVMHYLKHDKALLLRSTGLMRSFVCIAEDIVDMNGNGVTNSMLQTIVEYGKTNHIPVVQCFKRRKLARLFGRGNSMSCICFLRGSMAVTPEWKTLLPILDAKCLVWMQQTEIQNVYAIFLKIE